MKTYARYLLAGLLVVSLAGICLAEDTEDTLKKYGDIKGRTYHEDLYIEKQCDACHTSNEPALFPPDNSCLECHEYEDLVTATAREPDDIWQNPHNNLHYGKDIPCMECHGEHSRREPMCADCHNFSYTKHQK